MEIQMDLFESSWGVRADLKDTQSKLFDLIPATGKCEKSRSTNKYLERYRIASNLTHDLFNNALGNRRAEFRKFFGFVPIPGWGYQYQLSGDRWDQIDEQMEKVITPIIEAAAKEQGVR